MIIIIIKRKYGAVFVKYSNSSINDHYNIYLGNNAMTGNISDSIILNYSLSFNNRNYDLIYGFVNNFNSDLSDYYFNSDYVSSIKNQGNGGNCWAFSSLSTLESNILKIDSSLQYDFSEENMKNAINEYSPYGWKLLKPNGENILILVIILLNSDTGDQIIIRHVYCWMIWKLNLQELLQ